MHVVFKNLIWGKYLFVIYLISQGPPIKFSKVILDYSDAMCSIVVYVYKTIIPHNDDVRCNK